MTDTTGALFEALGQRGHEPLLEKDSGTIRFEIVDGKQTERWLVTIDKGDLAVSRKNVRADCTLRADKAVFDRVASGEMNAMAAFLRGDIVLDGDSPELLVPFQRLLPGPPRRRRRRRATATAGRRA
jgi:putative sterol carrier protein